MRTVRSAAWARNRPRRRLAWLIVLVLIALAVLIARVDAAAGDALGMAIRYADAITGADVLAAAADSAVPPSAAQGLARAQDDDDDEEDAGDDLEEAPGDHRNDDFGNDRSDDFGDDLGDDRSDDGDDPGNDPEALAAGAESDDDVASIDDARARPDDDPEAPVLEGEDPSRTTTRDDGALAELDAGAAASSSTAMLADASAGAAESHELAVRRATPSSWGRVDFGLALRRRWSEPMHAAPTHTTELWLVAIWRP